MPERQDDYPAILVAHLPRIDRIAAALCRKHALGADDVEEFASWAKARLMENDYAILRKHRGESQLSTYLTVVIRRLYQDYGIAERGRWRPSAAARRRGPPTLQLETLVHRDGLTVSQAAEVLRARGWPNLTDAEAARLLADLPDLRGRPRKVDDGSIDRAAGGDPADAALVRREAETHRQHTRAVLAKAMDGLGDEDRRIVEMRFFGGATVAKIALVLGVEQKPLYRRLERILLHLRRVLEAEGISAEQVREILDENG
jgi:RNA polymerase sigma factor for flagellar operon FliA